MAPAINPGSPATSIELINLPENSVVHHRLFLLIGRVLGHAASQPDGPDGFVHVSVDGASYPALCPDQHWELNATWFKALIPLHSGHNIVKLTCTDVNGSSLGQEHTFHLEYQQLPRRKKLRLAVVCAKDSPLWASYQERGKSGSGGGRQGSRLPSATTTAPAGPSNAAPTLGPQPPVNGSKRSSFLQKAFSSVEKLIEQPSKNHRSQELPPAGNDDGELLIDSPPGPHRESIEAGGWREVKRRFALQALMWQSFHAEQMRRHGFGSRTFELPQLAEDGAGITDITDIVAITFFPCKYTVKEMRDADRAQQFKGARDGGAMHSIASEVISAQGDWCQEGDAVAVLIGDSHWDPKAQLLRAHAAVGAFAGLDGKPSVGVCGSHWLWAAPSRLDQITSSFMDEEVTDERYCCNDLKEGRTSSLTVNIGSGAMLHEAGHAFANPHTKSGIMARGYIEWNRAFMTRETHSLRRASPLKPITPATDADENHIHRCQAVRAVYHPAFRHPDDAPLPHLKTCSSEKEWLGAEPFWRPTSRGALLTCSAGLALIEIDVDGRFKTHIEYIDPSYGRASNGEVVKSILFSAPGESSYPPTSLLLSVDWIRNLVGFDPMSPTSPEVKLNAVGCNLRSKEMDSYRRMAFAQPLRSLPGIPDLASAGFGREVRNGPRTKVDDDRNHKHYAFLLNSAWNGGPRLIEVDVFALPNALKAIGFRYSDGSVQVVGDHQGAPLRRTLVFSQGEALRRILIRSGWWIDAASVESSMGQRTEEIGGDGGGRRILEAGGDEEEFVGVVGSSGAWLDSLGILVADKRTP